MYVYEFHIAHGSVPAVSMTAAERSAFADPDGRVTGMSAIQWTEHCTECAWPSCYTTCDLYEARIDGHCRRFVDGMIPVNDLPTLNGYGCEIAFKRWGKLMGETTMSVLPRRVAQSAAKLLHGADGVADRFNRVSFLGREHATVRLQTRAKLAATSLAVRSESQPDYFLVEVFNPQTAVTNLSLSIYLADDVDHRPFLHLLAVDPGFNRFKVPAIDIAEVLGNNDKVRIELTPNILNPEDEGLTLVFGTIAFVADDAWSAPKKSVKVVVWDLDNTLWDGVLVEDGPAGVQPRHAALEMIKTLDSRGIVNSIASKNDLEPAMAMLRSLEIDEYFVFPEVSWDPKSQALDRIIQNFNVGADTVVFVDDQPFERAEVASEHPKVRLFDGSDLMDLTQLPEFDPPVSSESAGRREFYKSQATRAASQQQSSGSYEDFLRGCDIRIRLGRGNPERLERIHELLQRTNQMNFSGNRYSKDEIPSVLAANDCFTIDVDDRFGAYGMVGFAAVDPSGPTLIDLAFSCRIQSKNVEHAVLTELMNHYRDVGASAFNVDYRPTEKNAPAARVFEDLAFQLTEDLGDRRLLRRDLTEALPESTILTVTKDEDLWGNGVEENGV